ncbi:MAG TPA: hypothetical protein VGJ05_12745 [Fimbriiglobus sp.]|jgi:hypothetical protein
MSVVTLDESISENLRRATGIVELRDGAGKVLGVFAPFFRSEQDFTQLIRRILPHPDDVRHQKAVNEKTFSTDEVKAHLRSLGAA